MSFFNQSLKNPLLVALSKCFIVFLIPHNDTSFAVLGILAGRLLCHFSEEDFHIQTNFLCLSYR